MSSIGCADSQQPSREAGVPRGIVAAARRAVPALLFVWLVGAPAPARATGLVAVLQLDTAGAKIDDATRLGLEESIRTIAGEAVVDLGFSVLSRETTLALLADNGIDPSHPCTADCRLGVARELKASYFITGSVTLSEGVYVATLRLIETVHGEQLGSLVFEGTAIRDLRRAFYDRARVFFERLKANEVRRQTGGPARTASWVLVGVGVAVAIVGTVFAIEGKGLVAGDTVTSVDGIPAHSVTGVAATKANRDYLIGDVLWGAGGAVALGGGLGLLLTVPRSSGAGGDAPAFMLSLHGSF